MTQSKALEVNLRTSRVDVVLDPRFDPLLQITSDFHGISENLKALLTEVCHPYKNWEFIVGETRRFALHHFHLFKDHPQGPQGIELVAGIFLDAAEKAKKETLRAEALDNLLAYLGMIMEESGGRLPRFLEVLHQTFKSLGQLPGPVFRHVKESFYRPNDLMGRLVRAGGAKVDYSEEIGLLKRYLNGTYDNWLAEPDPRTWLVTALNLNQAPPQGLEDLFRPVAHEFLQEQKTRVREIEQGNPAGSLEALSGLSELPGFRDIVDRYEQAPARLAALAPGQNQGTQWKLVFLFHMMGLAGLSAIHERILREINRTLAGLIETSPAAEVHSLMDTTFSILKQSAEKFPQTAFNTVLNMGQAVYRTDDSELVEHFILAVADLGFQKPDLMGVGEDWQVRANAAHIQNIRVWMELAALKPAWSRKILSALIVHLALYGIFIKDTDLFPRDITRLLNSDIQPVYNLVKQLCRLFPSYFNEIGAEGRLRDISTQIDEISQRRDPLIHYLRKQSHVESSPQTVVLMEAIFEFWHTLDPVPLQGLVPPDIFSQISTSGRHVDGMHRLITDLHGQGRIQTSKDLLQIQDADLNRLSGQDPAEASDQDHKRLKAAVELYQRLSNKYFTGDTNLEQYIRQMGPENIPAPEKLRQALNRTSNKDKLADLLDYLADLRQVILNPEQFEIREDIYHKRHIAVDIPSMYGSYHEPKFDALGLTFRLETLANTLFQELMDSLDLTLITRTAMKEIREFLKLCDRALEIDGIRSQEFKRQLDLLTHSLNIRGFSFTQYMDIFRGFSQAVGNIVNDYFNNVHQNQLERILTRNPILDLLPKFLPRENSHDPRDVHFRVMEIFLRERIAGSLGLQQLDVFIGRILKTVFHQDHQLPPPLLRVLLNHDPEKSVTPIIPVKYDLNDLIHLGAKGYNLVKLTALGLPVPPGFIITTEVFRCREVIDRFPPAQEQFRNQLTAQLSLLENRTGRRFGDPKRPLLLSVRSGSSISQPGMLSTFLNVGLNEDIAEGMSGRGNGERWFAWDCFRRFLQTFGMAHGLKRDDFDALIADHKDRLGLNYKKEFSGHQMKQVALAYQDFIRSHGIMIEERPFEQLLHTVQGVFDSWDAPRAKTYRQIMGISSDWGTAVTVQAMIFGNLSQQAGSGVVFSHNPRWSGDKLMLWGDFALGNQGEDVVSGLVKTLPVTRRQAEIEGRSSGLTMESHFPELYGFILDTVRDLVHHRGYSPQELEFTFESPSKKDFYFLQNREMVLREKPQVFGFDPSAEVMRSFLGRGIGVSGGGLSGRLVFSLEEIEAWRAQDPSVPVILVRGDTVPDDIREIHESDGLLTARGGSTSHAAIVAHRLNKTCVVGCGALICNEKERTCRLGELVLASGDWISIDGLDGAVYLGRYQGEMTIRERRTV